MNKIITDELSDKMKDLEKNIQEIETILKNCNKEIMMWRHKYIDSIYISHGREGIFVTQSILAAVAGIDNPEELVQAALKWYRELKNEV